MAETGNPATEAGHGEKACIERKERLPDYAFNYYDSMRARFETLAFDRQLNAAEQKADSEARKVIDKACAGKPLTWADLMRLDLALVRLLDFEALRLRVAELQSRLSGVQPALPDDLVPKPESVPPANIEKLRAAAELLVTRLWQLRMARDARDRYVGELRRTLYWCLLIIIILFSAISAIVVATQQKKASGDAAKSEAAKETKKDAQTVAKAVSPAEGAKEVTAADIGRVPLFFVIMIAGMLGALISILRRLQAALTAPSSPDLGSELSALAYERRMTFISLFSGAVFAIVLYVAFVAGLSAMVGGAVAPEFTKPSAIPAEGTDFLIFVTKVGPVGPADYALVVLWSFIAGFSEQLVPDVLDRIIKKGSTK